MPYYEQTTVSTGTFAYQLPTGTVIFGNDIFPFVHGVTGSANPLQMQQAPFLLLNSFLNSYFASGSWTQFQGAFQPSGIAVGWSNLSNTVTFASADSPSYVVAVNANATGTVGLGTKFRVTHLGADKNFIVTQVNGVTGSTTFLNLYGGTDYDLNVTGSITNPYYSNAKSPPGFNLAPDKWTEVATDSSQRANTSASGTWVNLGSLSLTIPIGVWDVDYQVAAGGRIATTQIDIRTTLSTANNSESDGGFTAVAYGWANANSLAGQFISWMTKRKSLALSSKTQYFLNTQTNVNGINNIINQNNLVAARIRAVCGYL